MCGILAVFSRGLPMNTQHILESANKLTNRGPDSSSIKLSHNGVFVFKRLAINDLEGGYQPFVDECNNNEIIMMCNGEIYNHASLAEQYGITCKTSSDCEVIVHLFKKIGFAETVRLLDGDFAIVLVHGSKCYFARDRIGVRPLFIGITFDGWYTVASTASALLPYSSFVKQVPPATCFLFYNTRHKKNDYFPPYYNFDIDMSKKYQSGLVVKQTNGKLAYFNYFSPMSLEVDTKGSTSFELVANRLEYILTNAVRKRLMSDRPIGCLLSGGLDSSIITAILVKLLGSKNVRTYSIGMEGSTDLFYAKSLADYLQTQHTEVKFTEKEGIDAIPQVIKALESYDITTVRASVGMFLLSKYIKQNTTDTVIFSGEGSDELFCGYLYFHNAPDVKSACDESKRLVDELYKYDVLRADRVVSCHGLELRVPFLDRQVVDLAFTINEEYKVPFEIKNGVQTNRIEKHLLRHAFRDLLPENILNRQKCAFSDGVSQVSKSWYKCIQEYVEPMYDDYEGYRSKEDRYYKTVFSKLFPSYDLSLPTWMPRWSNTNDPSARTLEVCTEK